MTLLDPWVLYKLRGALVPIGRRKATSGVFKCAADSCFSCAYATFELPDIGAQTDTATQFGMGPQVPLKSVLSTFAWLQLFRFSDPFLDSSHRRPAAPMFG